jgi:phosphopantothenoylcysteine decarboxylase/phosphopantothenate--cysteine ligase
VTLIAANAALDPPPGVALTTVETAAELKAATDAAFDAADMLLMAAAVADFRPATAVASKIKKTEQDGPPTIELEHTDDILSALAARRRPGQVIVGFAAEHGSGAIDYGLGKLTRKGVDAIIVNDISEPGIGFDSEDNEVTILTRDGGRRHIPRASKAEVAGSVLDEIERLGMELDGAA